LRWRQWQRFNQVSTPRKVSAAAHQRHPGSRQDPSLGLETIHGAVHRRPPQNHFSSWCGPLPVAAVRTRELLGCPVLTSPTDAPSLGRQCRQASLPTYIAALARLGSPRHLTHLVQCFVLDSAYANSGALTRPVVFSAIDKFHSARNTTLAAPGRSGWSCRPAPSTCRSALDLSGRDWIRWTRVRCKAGVS
jgi:hypothetical protein